MYISLEAIVYTIVFTGLLIVWIYSFRDSRKSSDKETERFLKSFRDKENRRHESELEEKE